MEYYIGNKAYVSVDARNDFYAIILSLCAKNELPRKEAKSYLSYIGNKSCVNPVLDWISCN
jgi:hypothetical protein